MTNGANCVEDKVPDWSRLEFTACFIDDHLLVVEICIFQFREKWFHNHVLYFVGYLLLIMLFCRQ